MWKPTKNISLLVKPPPKLGLEPLGLERNMNDCRNLRFLARSSLQEPRFLARSSSFMGARSAPLNKGFVQGAKPLELGSYKGQLPLYSYFFNGITEFL